jgi:hypothetical protein
MDPSYLRGSFLAAPTDCQGREALGLHTSFFLRDVKRSKDDGLYLGCKLAHMANEISSASPCQQTWTAERNEESPWAWLGALLLGVITLIR